MSELLSTIRLYLKGFLILAMLALLPLALPVQTIAAPAAPDENEEAVADEAGSVEENLKVAKALEELLESMKIEAFNYETEGRPDPFTPFISEKVIQQVEVEEQETLTGMRQFEPGQLTLVAIMFTESNPMAMVEDSSHKGYIIKRGTKIGKSGIVSDILPNQVVIKQLSYSMAREKKYRTVEMILRKEGEK